MKINFEKIAKFGVPVIIAVVAIILGTACMLFFLIYMSLLILF